jgi:hypothetical protein
MEIATDIGVTSLTEGEVVFSSVDLILNDENAKVWEFDGRTKYLDADDIITMIGTDQDGQHNIDVMFFASERSLHTNEDQKGEPTIFKITLGKDEGDKRSIWDIAVTTGRYTTRIIAYRVSYNA